ncbi:hypothetical protein FB45DRAFT_124697 [Roridomyces roridus]|uniref:Uncharacterized protein n=1 Tax=Roridomyces roridus TaxID=1738132 RepID=A0AAD7BIY0_9AGAR|nr:hypothetical protein FB45DRAFT_124697 [Roridomyces roridus]
MTSRQVKSRPARSPTAITPFSLLRHVAVCSAIPPSLCEGRPKPPALLKAKARSKCRPCSFTLAMCSRPVIHSGGFKSYLPQEDHGRRRHQASSNQDARSAHTPVLTPSPSSAAALSCRSSSIPGPMHSRNWPSTVSGRARGEAPAQLGVARRRCGDSDAGVNSVFASGGGGAATIAMEECTRKQGSPGARTRMMLYLFSHGRCSSIRLRSSSPVRVHRCLFPAHHGHHGQQSQRCFRFGKLHKPALSLHPSSFPDPVRIRHLASPG